MHDLLRSQKQANCQTAFLHFELGATEHGIPVNAEAEIKELFLSAANVCSRAFASDRGNGLLKSKGVKTSKSTYKLKSIRILKVAGQLPLRYRMKVLQGNSATRVFVAQLKKRSRSGYLR